jgi:hypothetical protein
MKERTAGKDGTKGRNKGRGGINEGARKGGKGRNVPRLRHGVRGTNVALQKRNQPLFLLIGGAVTREYFHVSRVRTGAVSTLARKLPRARCAQDLTDLAVLSVRQAACAYIVFFLFQRRENGVGVQELPRLVSAVKHHTPNIN